MARRLLIASIALACSLTDAIPTAAAQSAPTSRYPFPPQPLPEAEEVALAMSAAPADVSSRADVYVLRGTAFVKVRTGTNGCACIVSRDLHEGSFYPICFDQEGTRSLMLHEMRGTTLRAQGMSEANVKRAIDAAIADGSLPLPTKTALAYMMSPRQVLFSNTDSTGRRVGAWHPHVMIAKSGLTATQLGIPSTARLTYLQVGSSNEGLLHELVLLLPVWSDGSPAPAPRR